MWTMRDALHVFLGLLLMVAAVGPPLGPRLWRLLTRSYPHSSIAAYLRGHADVTRLAAASGHVVDVAAGGLAVLTGSILLLRPQPPMISMGLATLLLVLVLLDLRYRWLPDLLTATLVVAGFAVTASGGTELLLQESMIGAIGAAGLVWLVAILFRTLRGMDGIGGGDIKLMAGLGAWLGPPLAAHAIGLAAVSALLFEITFQLAVAGRIDRTRRVPFGVYLSAAFWAVWCLRPYLALS